MTTFGPRKFSLLIDPEILRFAEEILAPAYSFDTLDDLFSGILSRELMKERHEHEERERPASPPRALPADATDDEIPF